MTAAKNPKKLKNKIDWPAIREDWIVQNLDKKVKTKPTKLALAIHWGVSRDSVDRHAKKEDWAGELRKRTHAIANARIDAAQDGIIEKQRKIREHHGKVASGIISKATQRFNAITNPEEDIDLPLMLKMFAFGLPAEREAAGMPKLVQIQDVTVADQDRLHETPTMRMERRRIERLVDADLAEAYPGRDDAGD
jgi:hypothetical protein